MVLNNSSLTVVVVTIGLAVGCFCRCSACTNITNLTCDFDLSYKRFNHAMPFLSIVYMYGHIPLQSEIPAIRVAHVTFGADATVEHMSPCDSICRFAKYDATSLSENFRCCTCLVRSYDSMYLPTGSDHGLFSYIVPEALDLIISSPR